METKTETRVRVEQKRIGDMAEIMGWRLRVLREVFADTPDVDWDLMACQNYEYYKTALADGSHVALVATVEGEDAGCGSMCIYKELPSPDNVSGLCAFIMNMYVVPKYRRGHVGSHIVNRLIEEARSRGITKVYLETTPMARSFYDSLGFEDYKDIKIFKR